MPRQGESLSHRYPVALVTGASSGLGAAIATALVREEITVYGTTRNPHQSGLAKAVHWLAMDASLEGEMIDWIKNKNELLDNIDILINNCGAGVFGDIVQEEHAVAAANRQLLLGSPVMLVKAVLPQMRKRGGAIVNISSLASQFPLPYLAGYTAAKAGLSAFTQSLMLTEDGGNTVLIDFQAGDFRTAFNQNAHRLGNTGVRQTRVWKHMEKCLRSAPSPERAAEDLIHALRKGKSAPLRSGGFFQTKVAPLGIRLLPRRLLLGLIRRYYGMHKG